MNKHISHSASCYDIPAIRNTHQCSLEMESNDLGVRNSVSNSISRILDIAESSAAPRAAAAVHFSRPRVGGVRDAAVALHARASRRKSSRELCLYLIEARSFADIRTLIALDARGTENAP